MNFTLKKTKRKEIAIYKYLYIKENLVKKIEEIARVNDTSFNNVIISMIESCLNEQKEEEKINN